MSMRIAVFALVAAVISASCVRRPEVIRLYEDTDWGNLRFERLLVVAIAGSEDQQQALEDGVVENIRRAQSDAAASYTMLAAHEGVDLADVEMAAKKIDADGILVSRITSVDTSATTVTGREYIKSECRGGELLSFFLYDREVLKEADSIELAHTVVVVTELYDASTQERLWMIQSTCFDRKNLREALQEEADVIVRQLRQDQLI